MPARRVPFPQQSEIITPPPASSWRHTYCTVLALSLQSLLKQCCVSSIHAAPWPHTCTCATRLGYLHQQSKQQQQQQQQRCALGSHSTDFSFVKKVRNQQDITMELKCFSGLFGDDNVSQEGLIVKWLKQKSQAVLSLTSRLKGFCRLNSFCTCNKRLCCAGGRLGTMNK